MRYLKSIFESEQDNLEKDILDCFIFITDEYGSPTINKSKYVDSLKWQFSWELDLDISHLQKIETTATSLKKLNEIMSDIMTAADKFEDYDFDISITDFLKIEVTPKESGSQNFEFIQSYDFRTLYVQK
jgi:hypothetical protein